jgi:hypothetical protein
VIGSVRNLKSALKAGRARVRFPMVSLEVFIEYSFRPQPMALGLTQTPKEMSTRRISWGVTAAGV